ncbi:MAG: hypothetical protein ACREV5_01775 [Steroidobacter sp.]
MRERSNAQFDRNGFLYRDDVRTDVKVPGFTSVLSRVNNHD